MDESQSVFKIIYSSKGLEKYKPPQVFIKTVLNEPKVRASSETSHRANFSQFGIVLRQVNTASNGDSKKSLTKIFYLQQVDFGGYFLPTQSQVQLLSNFMLEFIELACERSVTMVQQKLG